MLMFKFFSGLLASALNTCNKLFSVRFLVHPERSRCKLSRKEHFYIAYAILVREWSSISTGSPAFVYSSQARQRCKDLSSGYSVSCSASSER